jgi:hypothetical protein
MPITLLPFLALAVVRVNSEPHLGYVRQKGVYPRQRADHARGCPPGATAPCLRAPADTAQMNPWDNSVSRSREKQAVHIIHEHRKPATGSLYEGLAVTSGEKVHANILTIRGKNRGIQ